MNLENQWLSKGISRSCVSASLLMLAAVAQANPSAGKVVGGSASINYGTTTVITQTSNKAIINWQDFSIDQHETTRFKQPSKNSVTLNRVTGNNLSNIQGNLQANGTVFLVNPNGIVFGPSAQVNVGSIVASTANISDKNFMAGNYHFSDAPESAFITNQGTITVAQAGMAALVSPGVENSGVINAQFGNVVLASGKQFTLDLYGDGLITFDADVLVEQGMVENLGSVYANGGQVLMTAQAADTVLESLINVDGYIEATSVSTRSGKVIIQGYDNSTIKVAGTINVSGDDAGESGGVVQASANYIELLNGSVIDVSGDTGGGTVHIGSDQYHNPKDDPTLNTFGLPSVLKTAQYVYMAEDANIYANAASGTSGDVVLWADQYAWIHGSIEAKNNGRVETSGYEYLDVSGAYVLAGEWLLDPADVEVTNNTTLNGMFSGTPSTFTPSAASSQVSATQISTMLNNNVSVIIVTTGAGGNGDVTFSNNTTPVSWTTNSTFTVNADRDIIVDAGGATVVASTGSGDYILQADSDASGGTAGGTFKFTDGNMTYNTGDVNIFYSTDDFTNPGNFSGDITGGTGTLTQYIQVNNAAELQAINTNVTSRGQDYVLNTDISLVGVFTPISIFTGTFSGGGHSITNLTVTGGNNRGLFGTANGATIGDVTLVDPDVLGVGRVGALIGFASNNVTLVGEIEVSGGTIKGTGGQVGGIVGILASAAVGENATLTNSAVVSGVSEVGGLIGEMNSGATISANVTLTNNGDVNGAGQGVGGVIGYMRFGADYNTTNPITNTGNVTAKGGGILGTGGIVGYLNAAIDITKAFNTGDVTGNISVGGIVGHSDGGRSIDLSFGGATNTITGNSRVGGIIGQAISLDVSNSLFGGTVVGGSAAGGIVGYNTGDVSNVIGIGNISGSVGVGAIIGTNGFGDGTLSDSLVDPDINSVGVGENFGGVVSFSAPPHNSFALQSTYTDEGFVFGANGWSLTSGFYASPTFCGASCRIALVLTPVPPSPDVIRIDNTVQQQTRNSELDNNPVLDPITLWNAEGITAPVLSPFEYFVVFSNDAAIRRTASQIPIAVRHESHVVFVRPVYISDQESIDLGEFSSPSYKTLLDALLQYRRNTEPE